MTRPGRLEAKLASGRQHRDREGELAEAGMDIPTLQSRWRRLYGSKPPPRIGRGLLELVVAWKLQELALGGLSATAKRQLGELAGLLTGKADLPKARQPRVKPGARLIRQWGGTGSAEPALLTGLVFDAAGERLTPTHANKPGRRYRYYISSSLVRGSRKDAPGDAIRVPAAELEAIVEDRLCLLLRDEAAIYDAAIAMGAGVRACKALLADAADLAGRWPDMSIGVQ